ncbi:MAG: hypothetical protein AAF750_08650 [Planctomycetota bacterium]
MERLNGGTSVALVLATLVIGLGGVGCKQTGRVPITADTRGERESPKILPIALIEFSDQVPDLLARDLYSLPVVRDTPGDVRIILGDIKNSTGGLVPTSDFELVQGRIRSNLINSRVGREKLVFVERRARLARIADAEAVVGDDPEFPVTPEPYDAQNTYTLLLDVERVGRGDTQLYRMDALLVSFLNNQIVFSKDYEIKQVN